MNNLLIIDKDKKHSEEIISYLKNMNYKNILYSEDLSGAFKQLESYPVSLVIYSSQIDSFSGIDLPKRILEQDIKYNNLKFLILQENQTNDLINSDLIKQYNVCYILKKPFRPKDILLPVQENYKETIDTANLQPNIEQLPAEHLISFIDSTVECFEMMTGVRPEVKDIFYRKEPFSYSELSANMNIKGGLEGSLCLSFEKTTARKITEALLQESIDTINPDVLDSVGEMVNIISGNAKKNLLEAGFDFSIGLPKVFVGRQFCHKLAAKISVATIPFETSIGKFYIESSLMKNSFSDN